MHSRQALAATQQYLSNGNTNNTDKMMAFFTNENFAAVWKEEYTNINNVGHIPLLGEVKVQSLAITGYGDKAMFHLRVPLAHLLKQLLI